VKHTTRRVITAATTIAVAGVVAGAGTLSSGISAGPAAQPVAYVVPAVTDTATALEARTDARSTFAERASRDAARDAARVKELRAAKAKAKAVRIAKAKKVKAAAKAKAARIAAKARASRAKRTASLTTGPVTPGSARALGKRMAASRGWTGSQWAALDKLWSAESGWNTTVGNNSSGAYGIPQALPGSKMASAGSDWRTSARTQISWGLSYIASRWGTPMGAYGNFQRAHWY
jgi:resuscitation-promoting factor RpfB